MTDRLRRARNESGFTLIELMVVVLVLGILMAIAIPTFLGSRNKAQNKAPQASLTIELQAAKLAYVDNPTYGAANNNTVCTALTAVEPSITCSPSTTGANGDLAAGASTKQVSVYVAGNSTLIMAARSASGTCYFLRTVETTGTVSYFQRAATTNNCSGADARQATVVWTTAWT